MNKYERSLFKKSKTIVNDALARCLVEKNIHDEKQMTDNTQDKVARYELDAKLETIEARMDGRVQRIEDKFVSLAEDLKSIRVDIKDSRQEAKTDKKQIIYTIIGSVIAFIGVTVGILALNASWQQNFLNSIDARVNIIQQNVAEINKTANR